jgi:hypothetical protein
MLLALLFVGCGSPRPDEAERHLEAALRLRAGDEAVARAFGRIAEERWRGR